VSFAALQGFLVTGMNRAVIRGAIPVNPVQVDRKPRQRSREVQPLTPTTNEAIRAQLGRRDATRVRNERSGTRIPPDSASWSQADYRTRTDDPGRRLTTRQGPARLLRELEVGLMDGPVSEREDQLAATSRVGLVRFPYVATG
jgi:hypothetical protein